MHAPRPSDSFLTQMIGHAADAPPRPSRKAAFRPLVVAAMAVGLLVGVALLGGFSGLKSSVTQSRHLSAFVAASATYCGEIPVVTLTSPDPTSTLPMTFSVDFGEPVTGFDATDVAVTNTPGTGTPLVTVSGGQQVYTISVSGLTADSTVSVSVKDQAATGTGDGCVTHVSNTATGHYTTLTITSITRSGQSTNISFNGTGAVSGLGIVNVKVCTTNNYATCTATATATTGTGVTGSWSTNTTGSNALSTGVQYYAWATQGSRVSQVFTFTL